MSYQKLCKRLTPLYPEGEAQAIVRTVLEVRFGLTPTDVYAGKVNELSTDDAAELEKMMLRLEQSEPVQYVLGEADFMHRGFHVEKGVLIPRPETETLCRWVMEDYDHPYCALRPPKPLSILDVGTGSGCIAITLALDLDNSSVSAWDLSGNALLTARNNALRLGANVNFQCVDILHPSKRSEEFDIIVSNPPYICEKERGEMERNVLDYEPEEALFVPNDDPLRFYRAIAEYASKTLSRGGALYFETNPHYIYKVREALTALGFVGTQLRNDPFGKQRFIKAFRP